jgi:hypothetical protein
MDSIPAQSQARQNQARRRFLRMLLLSPAVAGSYFAANSLAKLLSSGFIPEGKALAALEALPVADSVISSPDQAFDVMDFEPAARKALPRPTADTSPQASMTTELSAQIAKAIRDSKSGRADSSM